MTYEETRDLMLEAYPRLYVDEADVLHDLFFLIGSGTSWENGELTFDVSRERYLEEARKSSKDIAAITRADVENLQKRFGSNAKAERRIKLLLDLIPSDDPEVERERERKCREEWAKLGEKANSSNFSNCYFFRDDGTIGREIYPIYECANILNIPQNIQPDWLAAAWKALEIARMKFRCTESDNARLTEAEAKLETISSQRE